MTASNGILALVGDPALRDDVDRVAAAAGLPVVHASDPSSRKVWTAAVAVLLDAHAARRCARTGAAATRAASSWSAVPNPRPPNCRPRSRLAPSTSSRCPRRTASLMAELSDAAEASRDDGAARRGRRGDRRPRRGRRLGVRDRTGADRDRRAADRRRPVGRRHRPGAGQRGRARSALARPGVAGRSARTTPRCATRCRDDRGVSVLSGSRAGSDIDAAPLGAVIDAGRRGGATVICDVPRRSTAAVGDGAGRRRSRGRDRRRPMCGRAPPPRRSPRGCRRSIRMSAWWCGARAGRVALGRGRRDRRAAAAGRDATATGSGRLRWSAAGCGCGADRRWRPRRGGCLTVLQQHPVADAA